MSLFDQASIVVTPNGFKAGKLYSIKPVTGAGDLDVVRATSATRVNANGLIESVGNNVPRLDYSNGSCPSILLEPQRTNLVLRSEEFNTTWETARTTVSADATVAPDGILTADKINDDSTASETHFIGQLFSKAGSAITYTASVYAKYAGRNLRLLLDAAPAATIGGTNGANIDVNLQTGAIIGAASTFGSGWSNASGVVTPAGGGWYRVTLTATSNTATSLTLKAYNLDGSSAVYTGDGTSGVFLWGAQLEVGSVATSYIPTVASTVTRNADAIDKTGISSLIGQTEGTVFTDIIITKPESGNADFLLLENTAIPINGVYVLFMYQTGQIGFFSYPSAAFDYVNSVNYSGQRIKVAYAYSSAGLVIYINGTQVYSSGSVSLGTGLSTFGLNNPITKTLNAKVAETLIFKTRLTNAQLASLTTL